MGEGPLLDLMRQALWLSVAVSAPVLVTALAVGLAVGLLQALTSVQEMTLTFVPKLGAILVAFWITMGTSGQLLVGFWQQALVPAIAAGPDTRP